MSETKIARIGAFETVEPVPPLRDPHVLAILRPWADAGNAGRLVLSSLESRFGARYLGKLARPGNFYDFTRYRPAIYSKEGDRNVSLPNTTVSYARHDNGHDFVFLNCLEPHASGEEYVDSVLELLRQVGARRYSLLGSMYDMVPHTRRFLVTGGAIGKEAHRDMERTDIIPSDYEGPTTINFLIDQRASALNIETLWFLVHLPQYIQLDNNYIGKARLMEVLESMYGFPMAERDRENARQQSDEIHEATQGNRRINRLMPQLEKHYDDKAQKKVSYLSPELEGFLKQMGTQFNEG